MKKIFGVILLSIVSLSFLVAQEEEESSFGNPSFSLENELTVKTVKFGEENNKGNVAVSEIENATTAKFAVGFAIGDNFVLMPYLSDKVTLEGEAPRGYVLGLSKNELIVGLGGKYKPMDMLALNFGLGYVSEYGKHAVDSSYSPGNMAGNGVAFNAGIDVEVESVFLEFGVGYKLKGMFANVRTGSADKDIVKYNKIKNTITLETKFDFFNFIKEGLNSGLVLSNETNISNEWDVFNSADKPAENFNGKKTLENEFAFGLHFAPVEYMDFTFLTKVVSESESSREKINNKYSASEKATKIALSLGLEFSKDMFSFGIEYNPELSKKITDGDGKVTEEKNLEHEFKIGVGIAL